MACATDFHHVESVRRCALGDTAGVDLPGGWLVKREGDWLELAPASRPPEAVEPATNTSCRFPGECVIPEAGSLSRRPSFPPKSPPLEPPDRCSDCVRLGAELTIRNWQPGDRFRPAHTGSEEKLKRLFSEKHIPADQRPLWPVVLSGSQIVWVRGFPVAHDFAWVPGSGDAVRIDVLPDE